MAAAKPQTQREERGASQREERHERRPRHHLRHHPARRRAVAGHLAEHEREARDRAPARAAGRGRHRGRLPDRLAGRLRGRAGDRPPGRGPRHRRPRARSCRGHRRAPRTRYATPSDLGSTRSSRRRTSTSSTSCSRRARTSRARRAPRSRTRSRWSTTSSSPRWTPRAPTSSSPPRSCRSRSTRARRRSTSPTPSATRCRDEYAAFLGRLYELVPGLRDVVLSVHCHDDLGLAVANSFAGPAGGRAAGRVRDQRHRRARGQRVARGDRDAAAHARGRRRPARPASTRARSRAPAALVSRLTGYPVQPNKAIVGPQRVRPRVRHPPGRRAQGAHDLRDHGRDDGRARRQLARARQALRPPRAARARWRSSASTVDGQALNTAFKRFKEIADKKKQVTAMDLEALVTDELRDEVARLHARVVRRRGLDPAPAARDRRAARRPTATSVQRRLHRRRPGRRDLPRHQRRDQARGAAARVPHRLGHRRPGRARRGERRARARRPVARPARASPPTSSRRPRSPTCARSRTPSGACTRRPRRRPPRRRRPSSPRLPSDLSH